MIPFVTATRAASKEIVERLLSDRLLCGDLTFRFGFRVHGEYYLPLDDFKDGVFPLGDSCKDSELASLRSQEEFEEAVARIGMLEDLAEGSGVSATSLLGGFVRSLENMSSCPERTKIFFVLSDASDLNPSVPASVIEEITGISNPPTVYFVRPVTVSGQGRAESDELFDDWAEKISRLLAGAEATDESYLLPATAEDLPAKILETVSRHLGLDTFDAMDSVVEGYSPVSDQWVEEVWMRPSDLDVWIAILGSLGDMMRGTLTDKRKQFADALVHTLQTILGSPPIQDSGETLSEYLRRRPGIPVRLTSPLTQYELHEIYEMEVCEMNRLIAWVRSVRDLLARVLGRPDVQVSYVLQPYPEAQCPTVSAKGRRIEAMIIKDEESAIEDFSYLHEFHGEARFWIPLEFLP